MEDGTITPYTEPDYLRMGGCGWVSERATRLGRGLKKGRERGRTEEKEREGELCEMYVHF